MSTMANTTPIVTTVTKAGAKGKTPKETDVAPTDKRKEVQTRLNFGESSKKIRRVKEGSQNSSAGTLPTRPKIQDRLRSYDRKVFDQLGNRRRSAFKRLSDTYSPSTTTSRPDKENSDHSCSRGRSRRQDFSFGRSRPVEESYSNTCTSYRTGARHRYRSRSVDHSHGMKRRRESESPVSQGSESNTSTGGHWKSKAKRYKPTEEDLAVP
ncbi:hypothetical protein Tco_0168008 [Tanacetum coccineum]